MQSTILATIRKSTATQAALLFALGYSGAFIAPVLTLIGALMVAAAALGYRAALQLAERQPAPELAQAVAPVAAQPAPEQSLVVPAAAQVALPGPFEILSSLGLEVAGVQFKQPAKARAAKSK